MITIKKDFSLPLFYPLERIGAPEELLFFDIETTGLSNQNDRITEIGAVSVANGEIKDTFGTYADPGMPIP